MPRRPIAPALLWPWLSLLLLGACTAASPSSPATRGVPPPAREVLSNGMRLITQPHYAGDVVALQLWIGVGGRDEAPSERGYSHLVEHMLFKGTGARGRGFVDEEIEGVGGRTNAGTSYDYTYYYILLPAARAARGIDVLADMAFAAAFDPAEIGREREVVFEEGRRAEDSQMTSLSRRLHELVFTGHPYGFPVLGDPAALRAADRASLYGYYTRHYAPENMALVVVGPVRPEDVRAAAVKAFGGAAPTGFKRPPLAPAPAVDAPRRRTVERPERQAALGLGWSAPEVGHPDMFAMDLLAQVLGGAQSSRLNQALRERARLVASIGASYSALSAGGAFTVTAQFEASDEAAVEAGMLEEIRRMQEGGVTAAEVARAVTALESRHEFSRETAEGLALALGRAETVWTIEADSRYLDAIRAVTPEQVRAVARRYLGAPYARLAQTPRRNA
jgi:zinc protease